MSSASDVVEKTSMTEKPTFAGRIIALLVGFVLFAVAAEIAMRLLMPQWPEFYSARFMVAAHSDKFGPFSLGRPGFNGWFSQNNGDFRTHIRINEFGLRNDQPISSANGAIWVVGDSMTFGWGVEEDERYSTIIGKDLRLSTYNVASPGTDVCGYRALIERMPASTKPSAVVIGLVLENDLRSYDCNARSKAVPADEPLGLIDAKVWLTGNSSLYNVLALTLKKVDIVRQILMAVGLVNKEHTYKRFFSSNEVAAVVASTAVNIATLCRDVPPNTPCAVLVMPARFEILNGDTIYHAARVALGKALVDKGIGIIDPFNAFKAAGFAPTHFAHDGHWSTLGHQIAADAVAHWLRQQANN